ncbi:MAG TPA: hypothetical protein VFU40_05770 [Gemmatimonadales bacterium]|nr:hypothetical protein [Gemmatimonadales bacterium]
MTPATVVPEASGGRMEEASIRPARLVEGVSLAAIPVGPAEPGPDPLAYLDGVQRSEVIAYAGAAPIVAGEIAAAVRERHDRRLRTACEQRRFVVLARPAALASAGDALTALEPIPLPDAEPTHPLRDLINASEALDQARGALEVAVADRYRARADAWLIVDGSLSETPRWAADPRMVAISKSHSILPFAGSDLERYLRLPCGHRSSIYAPVTRTLAPVRAWGLRLWPWEGKDLLHGLIRIEVAPVNGTPELADAISRWILAERAPVSAPDRRWDRLLYGISSVEQYLRARA